MLRKNRTGAKCAQPRKAKVLHFSKKFTATCCGTRKNTYLSALTVLNNSNLYI